MDKLPDQAGVFDAVRKSGGVRNPEHAAGSRRRAPTPVDSEFRHRRSACASRKNATRSQPRGTTFLVLSGSYVAPCRPSRPPSRRLVFMVVPFSLALHHAREQRNDAQARTVPRERLLALDDRFDRTHFSQATSFTPALAAGSHLSDEACSKRGVGAARQLRAPRKLATALTAAQGAIRLF